MAKMTEVLEIRNFLSIKELQLDLSQINIITGEMGSGKSLSIKLLKFFHDIIPRLFNRAYPKFILYLDFPKYQDHLRRKFMDYFTFSTQNGHNLPSFDIKYTFTSTGKTFFMRLTGTNAEDMEIESPYLENLLQNIKAELQKKPKLAGDNVDTDSFDEFKHECFDAIEKEFQGHYPFTAVFTPASRAVLALGIDGSHNSDTRYNFLTKYKYLFDLLLKKPPHYVDIIDKILKAHIEIEENDELALYSLDGRKTYLPNSSSGQQEIIFPLMHLSRLHSNCLNYGKIRSIFIEEPSAQLYPKEQMEIINFIVKVFNDQQQTEDKLRFYITTHSPYVLNSLNNILKKGHFLEKCNEEQKKSFNEIPIQSLSLSDVAAYHLYYCESGKYIGETMIKRNYIEPEKIRDISREIDEIDEKLCILHDKFFTEEE